MSDQKSVSSKAPSRSPACSRAYRSGRPFQRSWTASKRSVLSATSRRSTRRSRVRGSCHCPLVPTGRDAIRPSASRSTRRATRQQRSGQRRSCSSTTTRSTPQTSGGYSGGSSWFNRKEASMCTYLSHALSSGSFILIGQSICL